MGHRILNFLAAASLTVALGCSGSQKSPDVKADIESALSRANLSNIDVSQDRDKGVVTLSGDVATEAEKQRAEEIARSTSNSKSLVIANQIAVRPSGFESEAKDIDSSLDSAIEKTFEAALVARRLNNGVKYVAKNGVLTLTGEVGSMNKRQEVEQLASGVPNVKQVVNELQIKNVKASTRK
jgi:hyperosmotically inducible periplasmic protein